MCIRDSVSNSGVSENPGAERRIQERVQLEVDIGLHSATQFYAGLSNDISEGGLFVSTVRPLPVGSEMTISFVLPGGHTVTTRGRVAWLSTPRDDESTPGMGVRFERLEPDPRMGSRMAALRYVANDAVRGPRRRRAGLARA